MFKSLLDLYSDLHFVLVVVIKLQINEEIKVFSEVWCKGHRGEINAFLILTANNFIHKLEVLVWEIFNLLNTRVQVLSHSLWARIEDYWVFKIIHF